MDNFDCIESEGAPIFAWIRDVPVDPRAVDQLRNCARLPFIYKHIAVMPDVHWGMGATVGSVIPTVGAIVPAAVGVDIGCGMIAQRTNLTAADLPDSLETIRSEIEGAVPHGRTDNGRENDAGSWRGLTPPAVEQIWRESLADDYAKIVDKHAQIRRANSLNHLGTLGTGNHFIEVCLDEVDSVWVMLHSGSRGVGNKVGTYFIERAREHMRRYFVNLPDLDLAYLPEKTEDFYDYVKALNWAQRYARLNREIMMRATLDAIAGSLGRAIETSEEAVNCHHNYVSRETHFGQEVWLTRKGAVRAREGDLGIIPGSMGARSYIVRGKGNPKAFHSCSHGAGRVMSREAAKRAFTVADHEAATRGIECRKDKGVIDETPAAYKPIDKVMSAQLDLVEVVHTLRQVVCVKG